MKYRFDNETGAAESNHVEIKQLDDGNRQGTCWDGPPHEHNYILQRQSHWCESNNPTTTVSRI